MLVFTGLLCENGARLGFKKRYFMSISYNSFCDDFYVDMYVNTRFDLPNDRDSLLTFFERITKQFPSMTSLGRDTTGYSLEESEDKGYGRWTSIDIERIGAGIINPDNFEQAFELPKSVIGLMPYLLGIRSLDVDCIDLTFGMDFDYSGNHNEIIAEGLFAGSPFGRMFDGRGAGALSLSPAVVIALDDECSTRIRLTVDSQTEENEIRNRKFEQDKPISLYMTARQYPSGGKEFDPSAAFDKLCQVAIDFMDEKVVPNFVVPLTSAISHRR